MRVLVGKVDAYTNQNKPQGSASLEGAEFTIKYYNVQLDTDPAKSGKEAIKTWVLKTNNEGYCRLSKDYLVSGDDFYYEKGLTTLPLGTITIQETKAPEGYKIDNTVQVRQLKKNIIIFTQPF